MARLRWRSRRLLQISKTEQITAYNPPPELVDAAQERTEGMVEYYKEIVHRTELLDWRTQFDYLERLARSCYLQGAQDAANVAARLRAGEDLEATQ